MKGFVFVALALAGCGLTDPGRPGDTRRTWAIADSMEPGSWHGAKLTYDQKHNGVVMYAGRHAKGNIQTGKVYRFESGKWQEICNKGTEFPAARYLPAFAYNPGNGRLTLVGGSYDGSMFANLAQDVWSCDPMTDIWSHDASNGTPRVGADLVWHAGRGRLMLVGGRTDTVHLHTIESTLDGSSWTDEAVQLPFDCAGAGQNVTYDSNANRLLALAGFLSPNAEEPAMHDEIYQLYGTDQEWTNVCEKCSGVPRSDASIVHLGAGENDTDENYVINGYVGNTDQVSGTWLINNDKLVKLVEEPPKRDGMGVAYDPIRDSLIAFGGYGLSCTASAPNDGECDETFELIGFQP